MNTETIAQFFVSDVLPHNGFILSVDTLNPKHLGPKFLPFVKAMDPQEYYAWKNVWGDYVWGSDANSDYEALSWLSWVLTECTEWACANVSGMVTDDHFYQFGFSDHDGTVVGWLCYPNEQ